MTKNIFNIILLSMILSSCSNFLTWHLDKGIHKNTSLKSNSTVESDNTKESYDVSSSEVCQPQQTMESMVIQDI